MFHPRIIGHVDMDSFFASCQVAMNPDLRGKAVMTGSERGIVAACTYEAKARGVTRGMLVMEARQVCPGIIVLPSDYESYSHYSNRIFGILERFSPSVERYSIDEGFIDLTDMDRTFKCSHEEVARRIQSTIKRELDLPASIGLGPSKVIAKLCSKHRKPFGIFQMTKAEASDLLGQKEIGDVWGIGSRTADKLRSRGVRTAQAYAEKPREWIESNFSKPFIEIWHELNCRSVYPVVTEARTVHHTVSKFKTFTPATHKREMVFAQYARNVEEACANARRLNVVSGEVSICLRDEFFNHHNATVRLEAPTTDPATILKQTRAAFDSLILPFVRYRATGAFLIRLVARDAVPLSLFDDPAENNRALSLFRRVDEIGAKYGQHTLCLGSSLLAVATPQHEGARGTPTWRESHLLPYETDKRHLGLPVLDYF